MKISRRSVLKSAAVTGALVPLAGCERLISRVADGWDRTIPDAIGVAAGREVDPAFHLLSRAAYGPRPGDLDRVREIGDDAWIDEQLSPHSIDDSACDLRARRFETIHHEPGTCYEYKKPVLRDEISRHTLLRAVYSRRQLFEVMVGFWTDHLNVYLEKGDCIYLKPSDDREVIRAHALGRFRDMVRASATSPAMLVYLDGRENRKGSPSDVPNENYARELLELHTLGVDGGYTQRDVFEVARCLTGWRLRTEWRKGTVYFDPSLHDDGPKTVLGHEIPAGLGAEDLERVVDIVCEHPSTSRHVARKLARRFVSDDPPASLVDRAAAKFASSNGEIGPVVREILRSEEFRSSRGAKLKRPFELVVSALRATGADTHAHAPLTDYLMRMGQGLFQHPTPDGYAEEPEPWLGGMLWRWNFAFALAANEAPSVGVQLDRLASALGVEPDSPELTARLFAHFVGRAATARELAAVDELLASRSLAGPDRLAAAVGLVLSSPAFQRH